MLILTFCISINATSNNESMKNKEINIKYNFSKPIIDSIQVNGKTFDTIEMKGLENIGKIDEPNLPIKGAYILIPMDSEVKDITVTGHKTELSGKYNINLVRKTDMTYDPINIYEKNQLYPENIYEKIDVFSFRGYNILVLNIHPVQYSPESGQIFYYGSIEISIELSTTSVDKQYLRFLEKDEETLLKIIDNPEVVSSYHNQESNIDTSASDMDLLIITKDEFKSGFQTLSDFHNNRGLETMITTLSEFDSNTPEDIKNYIESTYNSFGIEYVLLGADVPEIPVNYMEAYNPALKKYELIPSDQWYGNVDGDLIPEIAVGRACVDDINDVSNFVSKTISYINDSSVETYDKCLMVGQKLMPLTFGGAYMDELINNCDKNDYSTKGIPEIRYHIDKLYEKYYTWEQSELVENINENNYNFINHLGHGNFYHIMKLDEPFQRMDNGDLVTSHDVTDLLKNSKPFFLYSQACYSGSFDNKDDENRTYEEDCIGEYLTVKTENAAFAAIMNSRYGLGAFLLTMGPNQFFNREFWDSVFEDNVLEIGMANQLSKIKNINRIAAYPELALDYCYWEITLLGDPTVAIKVPSEKYPHQPAQATFTGINKTGRNLIFSSVSNDPGEDILYYFFDWGDGTNTGWFGPFDGAETVEEKHAWEDEGSYLVRVKVKNSGGYESQWSEPTKISVSKIKNKAIDNPLQYGGYFIFGFMGLINPEESYSEFEVVSFVLLRGNGETIQLNQGEMIQIQGSRFCISLNNFFIGLIGDYSIIG